MEEVVNKKTILERTRSLLRKHKNLTCSQNNNDIIITNSVRDSFYTLELEYDTEIYDVKHQNRNGVLNMGFIVTYKDLETVIECISQRWDA